MAITKVGPFGGDGGTKFDDGPLTDVKKIIIFSGAVIDSIQFEYDSNGLLVSPIKRGGGGGSANTIVLDFPHEFITQISGSQDVFSGSRVVQSIKIQTNLNTYGPFGNQAGTSFSIPSSGGKIVGFFGASGALLDSIGAYVGPLPISVPFKTIGPFGGFGGDAWSHGVHTNIKKIRINAGLTVDAIQVEYENNGDSVLSLKNGGTGGDLFEINIDSPDEFIVEMSGHHEVFEATHDIIHAIKFKTNRETYGPFGTEVGTTFTLLEGNGKIVGFHGRGGIFLDAIGAYVVPTPTKTVGPFGGPGGDSWDDGVNTKIKSIEIFSSEVINSIQTTYIKNGTSLSSRTHGDSSGGVKSVIKLDSEEHVTSISGNHKIFNGFDVVSSLTIETNQDTYGPFGKVEGDSFSISGGKIVGLFGKSGGFIDSIGGFVV